MARKSPSFHVYEDHFHCFGCGEHGDAIAFVMKSQGAAFMEAVEQLAAEAGLEVPKPTPAAAEAERRRLDLHAVLDAAAKAFQRRLFLPEGRARAQLPARPRPDGGNHPPLRPGLVRRGPRRAGRRSGARGHRTAHAGEAGLMRLAEGGRPAADMFFSRVMFPIRDRRGRTISFGGRTLGDGQPKYVNGPETALFSKRRTLFGLDFAREAARTGATVVAVEGYMDVIALHQAGLAGAVAPLGTALTEEQLEELWRLSPCPVLCFDGDAAGARAATRAAELALPAVTAERSLKLATLPAGEDPDTLVRHRGTAGMTDVLAAARPLSDALFDMLRDAVGDTTPELRASLSKRLEATADRIQDRSLAWEYRTAFRARFKERYRTPPRSFGGSPRGGGKAPAPRPVAFTRPTIAPANAIVERARNLVAILLIHPALLHDVEEAFGTLILPAPLARLRAAMLDWAAGAELLDSAGLMSHLTAIGLAGEATQALSASSTECAAPSAMPAEAEEGWWHFFGLMHRSRLDEEVAQAVHDFMRRPDDTAAQRRVMSLRAAQEALNRGEQEMETEP